MFNWFHYASFSSLLLTEEHVFLSEMLQLPTALEIVNQIHLLFTHIYKSLGLCDNSKQHWKKLLLQSHLWIWMSLNQACINFFPCSASLLSLLLYSFHPPMKNAEAFFNNLSQSSLYLSLFLNSTGGLFLTWAAKNVCYIVLSQASPVQGTFITFGLFPIKGRVHMPILESCFK